MSRNIILISVDSLRADMSVPGGRRSFPTPAFKALGNEGIVFANAVAPGPNTPSSMPAVMTGAHIYGVDQGVAMRDAIRNHLGRSSTIADRLSQRGYTTIGYTPNPFTSRYFGFDKGFDDFIDFLSSRNRIRNRIVARWTEGRFIAGLRLGLNMLGYGDLAITWEDYYEQLLSTVKAAGEPFFLWVFLLEPHWPYYPPARFRGGTSRREMYYYNWKRSKLSNATIGETGADRIRTLYEGSIRHVDEFVGRIATDLDSEDPIIVFHSDHGEAFGEHGLFGHGQYLYEENIHVPLIVGNIEDSKTVDDPISLCALPEMISQLAANGQVECEMYTDWFVPTHAVGKTAVRGQNWKYIEAEGQHEFYDLRSDPRETNEGGTSPDLQLLGDFVTQVLRAKEERERINQVCHDLESRLL